MKNIEIAKMIDHTLLAPNAKESEIVKLCSEADKNSFASVCVNPCFVKLCAECLKNSSVKVCTVIGFPLGSSTTESKVFEAVDAVKNGADEIDMVINISKAKDGKFDFIEEEVKSVCENIKKYGLQIGKNIILKVILETCFLEDSEIVECCKACVKAKADFVKTSTGFATVKSKTGEILFNGATVSHVKLMKKTVGADCKVKASGGIRSLKTALEMIEAGAERLGTSSGIKIISEL